MIIDLHPSDQWLSRKFLMPIDHPETGTHMMPTTPWCLHQTTEEPVRHSPLFGQHCAEVLREELGIGPEGYAELDAGENTDDSHHNLTSRGAFHQRYCFWLSGSNGGQVPRAEKRGGAGEALRKRKGMQQPEGEVKVARCNVIRTRCSRT